MVAVDIISMILSILSGIFGFFENIHSYISTAWWIGKVIANFGNWVIGMVRMVAEFFAGV